MLDLYNKLLENKRIAKFSAAIFYIALFTEILIVLVDKSSFVNPFEGRMFQITFCLFLTKILLTKYSKKEYIVFIMLLFFGWLIDFLGDRNEIMRFAVAAFACKEIKIEKGLKFVFWVQSVGCLIIVLFSMLGIYGALTVEKEYQGEGYFTRYCFGMGNANSFHTMFFVSVLLGIYLYCEVIRWWGYLTLILVNMVLYFLTDCKTATGLTFMVIIVFWILPVIKASYTRLLNLISKGMIALNAVLLGLSIYFAVGARYYCKYYWDSFWEDPPNPPYLLIFFDKLLTGRILSLTEYSYQGTVESWSLFTSPNHTVFFDLGWVRLFYWYGIIPALLFVFILFYLLVWLYKRHKHRELIFVSFVLFHMFIEAHFVSVYVGRSYIILLIGMLLPEILTYSNRMKEVEQ